MRPRTQTPGPQTTFQPERNSWSDAFAEATDDERPVETSPSESETGDFSDCSWDMAFQSHSDGRTPPLSGSDDNATKYVIVATSYGLS